MILSSSPPLLLCRLLSLQCPSYLVLPCRLPFVLTLDRSQLKFEGVVLSFTPKATEETQTLELGEVTLTVDDVLNSMPPGVERYDKGMLAPNRGITTVMFNSTA